MSAWYSNIVGVTTSKISNLQRSLLNSEADGDTEDDTHICRVLRSYYLEKGRPFPGWLPPDPKAPPPVAPVYAQTSQVGSRYGGLAGQQPNQGGAALSSLWDNNGAAPPAADSGSLRRGRGGVRPNDPRNSPFRNSDPMGGGGGEVPVQARPLPSQRAGSHQPGANPYGREAMGSAPPTNAAGGGGSAQDRLKQRLWGGSRTTSPGSTGGPFNPPPQGGVSANSPWSSGGGGSQDYSAGGRPGYGRPGGLPSGPRMR